MRKILVCILMAGCGEPDPPSDKMRFRDDFDSLASAWNVSARGVSVEDGKLVMRAGVGASPQAKYTLDSPYGPGWEFQVHSAAIAGSPCATMEISTGHERRHTWALALDPDTARSHWDLQVGDGEGWQAIGNVLGGEDVRNPAIARLRVDWGDVRLWLNDVLVVDTMIADGAPNAVSIELGVTRCKIVGSVGEFDWVEIKEVDR